MEVKATNPAEQLDSETDPLLQAYFELNHLKQLYRQGWLKRGIPKDRCESVAEHSFAVAVLALWLAKNHYSHLDVEKLVCMALLHDLGEVYAGDIVPSDSIDAVEKQQLERESVRCIVEKIPGSEDLSQLWEEFEAGETPEALLIKQLDRLEMGLQAAIYRAQGLGDLQEFSLSARQALQDKPLIELLKQADRN